MFDQLVRMKLASWVRAFLVLLAVGATIELVAPQLAEARAGRGRSMGRSSFGSRGSNHSPYSNNSTPGYNQRQGQNQGTPYANQPAGLTPNRGGFLRGLAGGIAGGFLGSMLFGSLGHAAGATGTGGGIGILEILLFGGLAYFAFRWWKGRQQQLAYAQIPLSRSRQPANDYGSPDTYGSFVPESAVRMQTQIHPDEASDIFFKIQGAWTRRDLGKVDSLLTGEMREHLAADLADLKRNREINRLENISVRNVEVAHAWQEHGVDYSTVRFSANLLDYTVNEDTNQITAGSDIDPVKFEEEWTFAKTGSADAWQLAGIQQV